LFLFYAFHDSFSSDRRLKLSGRRGLNFWDQGSIGSGTFRHHSARLAKKQKTPRILRRNA